MTKKSFNCTQDGLVGAQSFLEEFCDSPKPAVVMDEIVSNIVRCSGSNEFSVELDKTSDGLKMVFTDTGVAFDPTKDAAVPDVSAAIDDRGIGGLGIYMVKKMSKSVTYRRDGNKNILTVIM